MPIIVTKAQMNKAGWQVLRRSYPEMEASGVGKALEAFKGDYTTGGKVLWEKGGAVWNVSLKRSVDVLKALAEAKKKAMAIPDSAKKKGALEVVTAYDILIKKFQDEILSLEEQAKKRAAIEKIRHAFTESLTFPKVVSDGGLLKAFYTHCAAELSLTEAQAAVGWQAQKFAEVALKYGKNNEWNQDVVYTKQLVDHYSNTKKLTPADLKHALEKITTGFFEMVTGPRESAFARFKKSKALDAYLQAKFPAR